jgi:hypothetical protein
MNKCIKCGSYAFNLYKEGIDQGDLCDVHYWKGRAHRSQAPDYAWPTVADYENDVGFEVDEAFRMAWAMARTTNALFTQVEKNT